MGYCVAGTERNVLERPAVLAERDLTFRAAIKVVENRLRQSSARDGPKVIDANDARRCNGTGCCRHRRFQ
jgi:hypothetical protein